MSNQLTHKDTTFAVGDTIRVHQTFEEGDKTRTQVFEGIVIAIRGHAGLKSYVVRKIATNNIGVEKIFPLDTPTVTEIEVKKKGSVRRAKLYYLRDRTGKKATKVKGLFVRGLDQPEREAEPVKTKVLKAEKPEKVKKVKKGPKKIVRKERQFTR